MFWRLIFLVWEPWAGSHYGTQTTHSLGRIILPFVGCLLEYRSWLYCISAPPSILLWFLLYIFTCKKIFPASLHVVFTDSWSLTSCLALVCPQGRKWAQGLSTPPSWTHTSPINMSLGIYPDELKTYVYAENMHSNICGSFIHNYQSLDAIKMCFSRWMDKVWYNHRQVIVNQ